MADKRKAFKVLTQDGMKRVGLVVESLQELKIKGCQKLDLECDPNIRVVLESDATLVDDEDYFQFLDPQTAFVLLTEDEEYVPLCMRDRIDGFDETDAPLQLTGNARLDELILALRIDLAKIVAFSPEDLQLLLELGDIRLGSYLDAKHGPDTARYLLEACQRFIDEHLQAKEYASLLQLMTLHMGQRLSGQRPSYDADSKRKRTDRP